MDLYCLKGKSGNMLSFKKSSDPDFLNNLIVHKLDLLLKEQVQQRLDLANINAILKEGFHDKNLQTQVDQYFEEDTSPQTDLEDK